MIAYRFRLVIGLCVICLLAGGFSLVAKSVQPTNHKRILLVDSYVSLDVLSRDVRRGFLAVLDEQGLMPGLECYDLAVRYQPNLEPSAADIEELRNRLKNKNYDLIIAVNNVAADLFITGVLKAKDNTPVLVAAYQGPLKDKIPPKMNMTGVATPLNLHENIQLGRTLLPQNKLITVLVEAATDGKTQTESLSQWCKDNHSLDNIDVRVLSGKEYKTDEILALVSNLPKDSLLLFHSWGSINEPQPEYSYTLLPKVRARFSGLILGKYDSYIELGSSGGAVLSGDEIGRMAGSMAVRIFHGERASDIPVQLGTGAILTKLDYAGLVKAGVSPAAIPSGVALLNRPVGFLQKYSEWLLGVAGVLVLIFGVVITLQQNKRKIMSRIEGIFNHLPQNIFVVNPNGKILYSHVSANSAAAADSIASLDDLPEEHRKRFESAIQETFRSGTKQEFDFKYHNEERHSEVIRLPNNLFGTKSVMWISSDLAELRQANRELEFNAERFRLTLESIGDAVVVTDKNQVITLINPVAAGLIGMAPDAAVGKPLDNVFNIVSYVDGKPVPSPLARALETGKIVELANHTDLISQSGKRYHIADSAAPIRNSVGEITGGVLVFRDVTEEYNKRDQLKEALLALEYGSDLTNSASFRINLVNRDIYGSNLLPNLWPIKDGKAASAGEFVFADDLESYIRSTEAILSGESQIGKWDYRSSFSGELRYYRMQASVEQIKPDEPYLIGVVQDVTEIARSAGKFKETLELWEMVINSIPVIFFAKDAEDDFRYILSNQAFADMMGKPRQDIIGKTDEELFPRAEDTENFHRKDIAVMQKPEGEAFEEALVDTSGNLLYYQSVKKPFIGLDGRRMLIGVANNVTELSEVMNGQKVINFCLETLFQETDAIKAVYSVLNAICDYFGASRSYIFDFDGTNNHAHVFAEYAAPGSKTVFEQNVQFDFAENDPYLQHFRNNKSLFLHDLRNPTQMERLGSWGQYIKDLDIRSLFVTSISREGQFWGNLGVSYEHNLGRKFTQRDTEILESAARLIAILLAREDAHNRLVHALEHAQDAERAKSFFIASVSHEIRTPLNSVIGFSELLRDGKASPTEQKEYVENIAYSGNALLQLINDVLDLSKLEAGKMDIMPVPTDFRALTEEVLNIFAFRAQEQGSKLAIDIPPLPNLELDQQRLRQILFNLIGNAVKFTQNGKITVYAEFSPEGHNQGTLRFRVVDTGIGIAKEDQKRLMEPFVQLSNMRGTNAGNNGTGFGLSITTRLAEKMNGTLWLESEPGKGSTFGVTLQRVKCRENCDPLPAVVPLVVTPCEHKISILLVDDVEMNLKVLKAMCAKAGMIDIVTVTSGRAALEELGKRSFDLVLTDMWMPEMNGAELLKRIKSEYADLPVAAVTADEEARNNFSLLGFSDILLKPITFEKVLAVINSTRQ